LYYLNARLQSITGLPELRESYILHCAGLIMPGSRVRVPGVLGALAAALLQNLSSLIVMFNAGRLLKFQELARES